MVRLPQVRELWGAVADEHANGAIFVTSGSFTDDARRWTAAKNLTLIDGAQLVGLIASVQVSASSSRRLRLLRHFAGCAADRWSCVLPGTAVPQARRSGAAAAIPSAGTRKRPPRHSSTRPSPGSQALSSELWFRCQGSSARRSFHRERPRCRARLRGQGRCPLSSGLSRATVMPDESTTTFTDPPAGVWRIAFDSRLPTT